MIAIVTDSLTDLDIFQDLKEACIHRRIPVYILLDQSAAASFLQMCNSLNVQLDELQVLFYTVILIMIFIICLIVFFYYLKHMKVRTITGSTYYMRSGARITGKVHERFMLIDGNRVATGSYR